MSDSFETMDRPLCPWDFPGKNTEVHCHFFPRGIPNTGTELKSPALAGGFFTIEPLGKPMTACILYC